MFLSKDRAVSFLTAVLFSVSSVLTFGGVPVSANSLQDKLNQATKEKQEALAGRSQAKQEMQGAMAQVTKLDEEAELIQAELTAIDNVINEANDKIAEKEAEIAEYETQIEENDEAFRARLRAMDESNAGGYLDLLLSSESISDLVAKIETIREITAFDQGIINNMIELKQGVEASKEEIVAYRDEQEEARSLVQTKQDALNAKLSEKQNYIKKLEQDVDKYDSLYQQAVAQEESLKKSIASSLSQSNTTSSGQRIQYSGGVFCWPAPSYTYISSEWGYRIHPVYKTQKYHSGMDLAAPGGSPILAAADGSVKFAGWNGGYGYCVIVDHGGGLQTLYAHSSKLLVSAGQTVTKGQKIALVGTTGTSTGNHLHFEVLNNGKSVNPRPYLGI